ncbi:MULTISPECIES: hypothetical protein [unclassified Bradyrhizobium]|uniref:hypothetical protein n=1 Tax=unclassified Bradyrhizobium TaxID=2631580 RepID=UPI00247A42A9|nr:MULTISPECIES: hypothetical protein [unclassified Bradyrhizobium]WGS22269.1 hypothetical protein MTX22_11725 [Bradyrhizobium sp. ISRA463]WGS29241.1 hypothetical protein MTX19_09505 [Bradyrhizobium sp. ISRA464]
MSHRGCASRGAVFAQRKFVSSSKCFRRGGDGAMSHFAAGKRGWQGFRMAIVKL